MLIFLSVRPTKQIISNKVPWHDYILAVAGLAVGLYLTVKYSELINRMGYITVPVVEAIKEMRRYRPMITSRRLQK